jgi:pilus assembly protein Flp/PilA
MQMFNFNRKEKGQGLVEYALILVLIAIVVIVAMRVLGNKVSDTFGTVNTNLAVGEGGEAGGGEAAAVGSDHPTYTQYGGNYVNVASATNNFCNEMGAPSGAPYTIYKFNPGWQDYYYGAGGGTSGADPSRSGSAVSSGTC